jgi:hypothetical protein
LVTALEKIETLRDKVKALVMQNDALALSAVAITVAHEAHINKDDIEFVQETLRRFTRP